MRDAKVELDEVFGEAMDEGFEAGDMLDEEFEFDIRPFGGGIVGKEGTLEFRYRVEGSHRSYRRATATKKKVTTRASVMPRIARVHWMEMSPFRCFSRTSSRQVAMSRAASVFTTMKGLKSSRVLITSSTAVKHKTQCPPRSSCPQSTIEVAALSACSGASVPRGWPPERSRREASRGSSEGGSAGAS